MFTQPLLPVQRKMLNSQIACLRHEAAGSRAGKRTDAGSLKEDGRRWEKCLEHRNPEEKYDDKTNELEKELVVGEVDPSCCSAIL